MANRTHSAIESNADSGDGSGALERAIDRFSMLHVLAGRVLHTWAAWQASIANSPVGERPDPEDVPWGLAEGIATHGELEARKAERRARAPRMFQSWCRHYDAYDDMAFAVDRWREALDAARASLPEVARWVDDKRDPPLKRWTAEVQRLMGAFGGHINRYTEAEVPERLDTAGFEKCMADVYAKLNDLKSIPKSDPPRGEQAANAERDRIDAAYGAMMEFIDKAAALARMARDPTPSGESAAGMNYGMAMVAWIDLRTVLTGSVRTVARACYAGGAPPIRLGRLRPSPSVIEAVADELGVVVRNAVYQDRPHPLDSATGESPREVRDRLGVRTPLDGWILFQADWDALTPEKRAFALAMLKCSSIDHDDLRVMAMREAECAIREVVRRAERGFPEPTDPPVGGSVGAKGGVVGGRDDAAMLAPCDLAGLLGVEQRALEKRLERWRVTNVGSSDFVEVADRTPRQPKYLYRLRVAKQVSKGMKKQE